MFLYIIIKKGIQMTKTILTLSIISSILSFNALAKTSYFVQIPLDRVSIIASDELKPSEEWKTFLNDNAGAFFADSSPLTDLSQLSSKALYYAFWENPNVKIPSSLINTPLGLSSLNDFSLTLENSLQNLNFLSGVKTVNQLSLMNGSGDEINVDVSGINSLISANGLSLINFGDSNFSQISNINVNEYFELSNSNSTIFNKVTFGSNIDLNIAFDFHEKTTIENLKINDGAGNVSLRLHDQVISNFQESKLSSTSKVCQKVKNNQLNLYSMFGDSVDPKSICNL